jgi:hypothetical protein
VGKIVAEIVRDSNALAPPPQAPGEALVDEFLQALEPTPEASPGPLDLGFSDPEPATQPEAIQPEAMPEPAAMQPEPPTQPEPMPPAAMPEPPTQPEPMPPAAMQPEVATQQAMPSAAMQPEPAEPAETETAETETEPAETETAETEPEPARPAPAAARPLRATGKTRPARNVQERVRALTAAEQQKLARKGEQQERVVLERMYGKNVWESLLRNPKLTPPEAARIARMGALPLPLLEIIVNNRAWVRSPQVRRALLSNPRLKKDMLMTVLRATPKNELKLMPKQMGYPVAVRQAAEKLLK